MRSPTRPTRLLVTGALMSALVLAACTADSGGQSAAPTAQPAAPTAAAAPTAQTVPATQAPAPTAAQVAKPGQPATQAPPAPAATGAPGVAIVNAPSQANRGSTNPSIQVYERNSASVVTITSLGAVLSPAGPTERPRGTGSGFVLDTQGHIVTNNHVIEQADQLTVTFADQRRTVAPADLIGRDPDNDLAVVRVDPNATNDANTPLREILKPVTLGDSDRITIGEDAIAMGAPLGLQQTVTAGIVSAIRNPGDEPATALELLGGAIQTDAAVNPGNSGGPLFNALGEVIGVNTAGLSTSGGSIGLSFAIPVNVVKRVAPELIQSGCYRHPLIGITTISLARIGQAAKRELGIPPNQAGLLVQEVTAGAQQAGIRVGNRAVNLGGAELRVGGDVVVAVDGRPVSTGGDLRAYVENTKRPGDSVTLTVLRDGQRQDVPVTLTEKPSDVC